MQKINVKLTSEQASVLGAALDVVLDTVSVAKAPFGDDNGWLEGDRELLVETILRVQRAPGGLPTDV